MTTTVVGACMLSALILMKDELVQHGHKVASLLKKDEALRMSSAGKSLGKRLSSSQPAAPRLLRVWSARLPAPRTSRRTSCSPPWLTRPASRRRSLQQAVGASRMCVCEARRASPARFGSAPTAVTYCVVCKAGRHNWHQALRARIAQPFHRHPEEGSPHARRPRGPRRPRLCRRPRSWARLPAPRSWARQILRG